MLNQNQKFTSKGKSYFKSDGAYQSEYDSLYDNLVPRKGDADTVNGQLILAASRLGYEYYNNANINAQIMEEFEEDFMCISCSGNGINRYDEACHDCDGYGSNVSYCKELSDDVDDFYNDFILFIRNIIPSTKDELRDITRIITEIPYGSDRQEIFSEENKQAYDRLMDKVMFYVLTNDNKNL